MTSRERDVPSPSPARASLMDDAEWDFLTGPIEERTGGDDGGAGGAGPPRWDEEPLATAAAAASRDSSASSAMPPDFLTGLPGLFIPPSPPRRAISSPSVSDERARNWTSAPDLLFDLGGNEGRNPFLDDSAEASPRPPHSSPGPDAAEAGDGKVARAAFLDGEFADLFPFGGEDGESGDRGASARASMPRASIPRSPVATAAAYTSPISADARPKVDVSLRHSSTGLGLGAVQSGHSMAAETLRHSSTGLGLGGAQSGHSIAAESSSRSEFGRGATAAASAVDGRFRRTVSESTVDPFAVGTSKAREGEGEGAGAGAGTGVVVVDPDEVFGASCQLKYRPPVRGAVHPSRPVSLELRPHPLRGALANQVTRLASLGRSLWAACDLGLMIWDVDDAIGDGDGCSGRGNNVGDDDAASYAFLPVEGSPASCIVADVASRVVWTGHRDGRARAWAATPASKAPILNFQAHRFAVTAMLLTPYGKASQFPFLSRLFKQSTIEEPYCSDDLQRVFPWRKGLGVGGWSSGGELWAGCESGELKCWPWEAVVKALSGDDEDAALMEKSYVDLRMGNLGGGPNSPINPEVRVLVGDHAHGRVWCAGYQYVAIWDARTRDCVKIFGGISGLELNSLDLGSPGSESHPDEDFKVGYAKFSGKKDKGGWLQRSRNAVLGAADVVRRVAIGGAFGSEESRKLEALVSAADGTLWGGYGNGFLAQWDWEGNKVWGDCLRPVSVKCLCAVGNRVWVGYADGKLQVLISETARGSSRKLLGSWVAHRLGVVHMAVCGHYVFTLGLNGSIRGGYISSPDRTLNDILVAAMNNRAHAYTRHQQLRVLVGTWNTAEQKASSRSVKTWLAKAAEASLVVVGLQEVEMGAGALGMAAVKETVGMGLDKVSASGQWWLTHLDNVLSEAEEFERVASRHLAGMLIGVWIRRKLLPYVGDVEVGAVACGFGRTLGNKGAVGVKLSLFRRTICVLSSHLAAHQDQTARRNADFEHIYHHMSFGRAIRPHAAAGVQNMWRGGNSFRRTSLTADEYFAERDPPSVSDSDAGTEDVGIPELSEADLLIWTGDLNYRIDHLSYDEIINHVDKKSWDKLLSTDQLRYEMRHGRTFHGLRESGIKFPPTYKFDKGTNEYDTSEKRRSPAWCDRVLFRDSFGAASDSRSSPGMQGLTRPCKASVLWYESCMDAAESDHKPVRCLLNVGLSVTNETDHRREYGRLMRSDPMVQKHLAKYDHVPETILSTNKLVLEGGSSSMLRLSNGDRHEHMVYVIICEGVPTRDLCPCGQHKISNPVDGEDRYPRGGYGFPLWLQVGPSTGVLGPCDSISVSVAASLRPEDRNQDQREKVVILVVYVKGIFSSAYGQHRICVSFRPSEVNFRQGKDGQRRPPPEEHRRVSPEEQRRPSPEEQRRPPPEEQHRQPPASNDSPPYSSRPEHTLPSSTQDMPDLLL